MTLLRMHIGFASPGSVAEDPTRPGHMVRWADHTGGGPNNVDHFVPKMSAGGFVRSATLALLHAGETVVPGAKGISKGLSGIGSAHHFSPNINFTMNLSGHGEDFASEVGEIIN